MIGNEHLIIPGIGLGVADAPRCVEPIACLPAMCVPHGEQGQIAELVSGYASISQNKYIRSFIYAGALLNRSRVIVNSRSFDALFAEGSQ